MSCEPRSDVLAVPDVQGDPAARDDGPAIPVPVPAAIVGVLAVGAPLFCDAALDRFLVLAAQARRKTARRFGVFGIAFVTGPDGLGRGERYRHRRTPVLEVKDGLVGHGTLLYGMG